MVRCRASRGRENTCKPLLVDATMYVSVAPRRPTVGPALQGACETVAGEVATSTTCKDVPPPATAITVWSSTKANCPLGTLSMRARNPRSPSKIATVNGPSPATGWISPATRLPRRVHIHGSEPVFASPVHVQREEKRASPWTPLARNGWLNPSSTAMPRSEPSATNTTGSRRGCSLAARRHPRAVTTPRAKHQTRRHISLSNAFIAPTISHRASS